jgi:hypothetical protein
MIAKHIPKKGRDDARRLISYILDAKDNVAVLWEMPEASQTGTSMGKLASYRITHCDAIIPGLAAAEIKATQSKNTRAKGNKTYHLMVSFPEGETPSNASLYDIEDTLCQALGYAEHQRVSAIHTDTTHLHMHIAINKIHPKRLTYHEPYRDYRTLAGLCEQLEIKHQLSRDNHYPTSRDNVKAREMQSHNPQVTLTAWVKSRATLIKDEVTIDSWQSFHDALGRFGLAAKLQGAGLVIYDIDRNATIKASAIDRGWSLPALSKRWGRFEASWHLIKPEHKAHAPRYAHEKLPNQASNLLYQRYQTLKENQRNQRHEARLMLQKERETYLHELKSWYRKQRELLKKDRSQSHQEKRLSYQMLSTRYHKDLTEYKEQLQHKKQATKLENTYIDWPSFLMKAALSGNHDALALLKRKGIHLPSGANWLCSTKEHAKEAQPPYAERPVKKHNLQQTHIDYMLHDGGQVKDMLHAIVVKDMTRDAVWLTITLASLRFKQAPLKVEGTDTFKQMLVHIAIRENLHVTFADEAMEAQRKQGLHQRSQQTALNDYIQARNQIRTKTSDVLPHRAWQDNDIGTFIYQGTRALNNGAKVLLLKSLSSQEILVKSTDKAFEAPKVGTTINIAPNGRIQIQQQGITR